ncbi:MAG: hypothetical protein AB7K09_25265 [Planctomycetota bacterium]
MSLYRPDPDPVYRPISWFAVTWLATVAAVAIVLAAGCAPAPVADEPDTVKIVYLPLEDRVIESVVSISTEAQVGSFEFTIEFDKRELMLQSIDSRLPPSVVRLEYDTAQFTSGRVRVLGVDAGTDATRPASLTGTFEVARLSFLPVKKEELERRVRDRTLAWQFRDAHIFAPLPAQDAVSAQLSVRFFLVERRRSE